MSLFRHPVRAVRRIGLAAAATALAATWTAAPSIAADPVKIGLVAALALLAINALSNSSSGYAQSTHEAPRDDHLGARELLRVLSSDLKKAETQLVVARQEVGVALPLPFEELGLGQG